MTLRSFLLLISAAMWVIVMGLFYLQAHHILEKGFRELERVHVDTVRQSADSILQARKYTLSTYRALLENNDDLSKTLIIAGAFRKPHLIEQKVKQLHSRLPFDVVDIVLRNEKAVTRPELEKHAPVFHSAWRQKAGFVILPWDNDYLLLSYSPLRNYGEIVGVLLLGFSLNASIATQIATTCHVEARFTDTRMGQGETRFVVPISLEDSPHPPLQIFLHIDSRFVKGVTHSTRWWMIGVGALSLLCMICLLHFFVEFGFVRRFKQVLQSIQEVATDLDRGIVREGESISHPIREVSVMADAFRRFTRSLMKFKKSVEEKSKKEAYAQMAEQVVHDLKSPLSALDMMLGPDLLSPITAKKQARIDGCLHRIKDIARLLSKKGGLEDEQENFMSSESLVPLLEMIVAEKQAQYSERPEVIVLIQIATSGEQYARIPPNEFKRVLSNLLDNAVEALGERGGEIVVRLSLAGEVLKIEVTDNGRGIASELLSRLGERGATFGKTHGSGLGLWHARETIEECGGNLSVDSIMGEGTTVALLLPRFDSSLCYDANRSSGGGGK